MRLTPVRTRLRNLLVGGIAALVLLPTCALAADAPSTTTRTPAMKGVLGKHGPEAAKSFEAWRGVSAPLVLDFLGTSTWSSIAEAGWATQRWEDTDYHMVWSMAMLPLKESASMQTGATGAYNHHFRAAAEDLVRGGHGDATIRLGWEMTGTWYKWSGVPDPQAYAAYWRQIVNTMRSVQGAKFKFDFNYSDQNVDPRPMYPGDAYVDFVGFDFYDQSWASSYPATDHVKVWNNLRTKPYGLDFLSKWAAERGKRISIPEWGVAKRCDGHGGGDDPYFVERVHEWVNNNNVAYEVYFNSDDNSCQQFSIKTAGLFPKAAETYQRLWKQTSTVTTASSTGSLTVDAVRASTSSNRSGSWSLHQSRLSGTRYVFVNAPGDTVRLDFWLDRSTGSSPTHTEYSAPWDLKGGSADKANPLDVSALSSGTHTLVVRAKNAAGVSSQVTVTFTK